MGDSCHCRRLALLVGVERRSVVVSRDPSPALRPDEPHVPLGLTRQRFTVSTENMPRLASTTLSLPVREGPLRLRPAMLLTADGIRIRGAGVMFSLRPSLAVQSI
ncbi:hypothetical protein N7522_006382 [Penicillium canescens]|nr:hypothetical protein N7522_006382 [Penicillium canescens]